MTSTDEPTCCDLGTCDIDDRDDEPVAQEGPWWDCEECHDTGTTVDGDLCGCFGSSVMPPRPVDLRHYGRHPLAVAEIEPPF
jgi:hypothetical protein